MSIFSKKDFAHKKEVVHKVKIPTQLKSKPVFCRNCNKQNTQSAKVCTQCGVEMKEPRLRRKMR